jgi:hypothetical protein
VDLVVGLLFVQEEWVEVEPVVARLELQEHQHLVVEDDHLAKVVQEHLEIISAV